MKFSHTLFALLSVPAICTSAMADSTPILEGWIPVDSLIQGRVIRPVPNPELAPMIAKVQARFDKLSDDKKKAIAEKGVSSNSAQEYNPDIWESKKEYDAYMAAWAKNQVQEREKVAMGMKATGEEGKWGVVSATVTSGKTAPLTLSALTFDSKNNTWISNNGILKHEEVSEGANFIFGAQTGHQWTLNKDDAFSSLLERVRLTKSTDGKFIYVYYNFVEASKGSGKVIAQGSYSLRFPVKVAGASLTKPGQR